MPKNKKSGFTLIELLVVVAIIGVLFAIAMPVFGNAGRKDTYRAAQQVATTLRLARQHAISHRQWTFVIFPNRDGTYKTDPKALNNIKKCLRSYAVVAATNTLDGSNPTCNDMEFEFVSDWKFLPEGIYFDDADNFKANYTFVQSGTAGFAVDSRFRFPYDPADTKNANKRMSMGAICATPNGHFCVMSPANKNKFWNDTLVRLRLTSAKYYDVDGNQLGEPISIPGTNSTFRVSAKTGMIKFDDADSSK